MNFDFITKSASHPKIDQFGKKNSMFMITYPYSGGEDNKDSVEDNQDGQKAQKKEPEPEKYVNLLIHCRKFKLLVYNFKYLNI